MLLLHKPGHFLGNITHDRRNSTVKQYITVLILFPLIKNLTRLRSPCKQRGNELYLLSKRYGDTIPCMIVGMKLLQQSLLSWTVVRPEWLTRDGPDPPQRRGAPAVASITMVPEEEATGKVKEIYADIKTTLGIDFVPNLYKVMPRVV